MRKTKNGAPALPNSAAENSEAEIDADQVDEADRYESDLQPADYLLRVMRDRTASKTRRDKAATSVLPYVHPRVSPIAPVVDQDTAAQRRMKEASDSLIQTMADFKAEEEGTLPEPTDRSAT
jgi:hypothetical protein